GDPRMDHSGSADYIRPDAPNSTHTRVIGDPVYAGRPTHKRRSTSLEEGVSNTPTRLDYRFAPATDDELRSVMEAYTSMTGRKVWPKMFQLLATAWRMHGSDT